MYGLINVMPPSNFAVSMTAISFVIACKKLKIAQIVQVNKLLVCGNIRFSSLFAAGDVSRETSPAAKSEEKRMLSQANKLCQRLNLIGAYADAF